MSIATRRLAPLLAGLALGLSLTATGALAASPPVKQIVVSHIGWKVNKTTGGGICTVQSGDECQAGAFSSEPGGFEFAQAVAGGPAPEGNVYVADQANRRVQELTASGEFALMFGRHVNATTGGDICTEAEIKAKGVKCQKGEEGEEPGDLAGGMYSIAVDPTSGAVYVTSEKQHRIDEFSASGEFVLRIGREVNQTKKTNLCTAIEVKEGVKCQAGKEPEATGAEHGALSAPIVTVSPAGVLYVGDTHRVQEFDREGKWLAEIREPLEQISTEPGAHVSTLAVDSAGNAYLVYEVAFQANVIREFDHTGKEVGTYALPSGDFVQHIAIDPAGRLAVQAILGLEHNGLLYDVQGGLASAHLITEFSVTSPSAYSHNIGFNGNDDLYMSTGGELVAYKPVPVGELTVTGVECAEGPEHETDVTFACTLKGEVNPWGVPGTEAWFRWGRSPLLGGETPKQPVEGTGTSPLPVSAPIGGALPNETLYVLLAGEDANVLAPEVLTSALTSIKTRSAPPRILSEPLAEFVTPTSAVFFGAMNPENTSSGYEFQYALQSGCQTALLQAGADLTEACEGVGQAPVVQASDYGQISVVQEVDGLQPASTYRYRLYAVNEKGEGAVGPTGQPGVPEGTFTTLPRPVVTVHTGAASAVTSTGALIAGSVESDGQPVTYSFELGIYNTSGTRYGTVFSSDVGASSGSVEVQQALSGLQPGVTYAYRISARFGDGSTPGSSATGEALTFTTPGLPAALLSPLAPSLLNVPNIPFPKAAVPAKQKAKGKSKHKRKPKKHKPSKKHKH